MGVDFKLLIYTHTDYSDVWSMLFGQLKKYLPNYCGYVMVNKNHNDIPKEFTTITYDDSEIYTNRLLDGLSKIGDDEVLLFMHEDMILYDEPLMGSMSTYVNYINKGIVDSIKLIYVSDGLDKPSDIDSTLISNKYSKFSIQPTLIKSKTLTKLLKTTNPLNIWDFERNVSSIGSHCMVRLGQETKRGIFHYDSIVLPYIATAIVKGKWNIQEYNEELSVLLTEYNIDKNVRGIYG